MSPVSHPPSPIPFNSGFGGLRHNHASIALRHAELDETVKLLQTAARPGERFLSSERESEIAYLSGIPFAQFDRGAVVARMPPAEYLRFLFSAGVRLVL